jgi:hypothetical protein
MRTSNVGNRLGILLATEENQETLCRGGWLHDLPDAKRLFDFSAFIDFIKPFGQFSVEGLMSAVDG